VRALLLDERTEAFVSSASAWEVATKVRLGKLAFVAAAVPRFAELLAEDGFLTLAITQEHALRAGSFDVAHRDPFDRMLAAQSELDNLPLLTRDPAFAQFGTRTLW
jgi:PIN domain nuclease of toxin-antitoxin system